MLQDLPSEVIYHIATFLPTASALTNLSQTCRRLSGVIRADDWRIFRAFVQSRFAGIETPPFWKEATQALTSRSRALDRYGIVGRLISPTGATRVGVEEYTRHDRPTVGYRPVIDSYEAWTGSSWTERREVLIWSVAAELILRIRDLGAHSKEKLFRYLDIEDITSHDDVCGAHLLRPDHPRKLANQEHFIFARYSGVVRHISISYEDGLYHDIQSFDVSNGTVMQTSLSPGPSYILAVHTSDGTVMLYHTTHAAETAGPFATVTAPGFPGTTLSVPTFIASQRIALATSKNSILVHDIASEKPTLVREILSEDVLSGSPSTPSNRMKTHAISSLASASFGAGSPGNVFLAGKGTGRVRLYDLRSPKPYEKEYSDSYDMSPSYCILPFGHDRFIVGAGVNAVVKIFDLRMPTTSYSHTNAALPQSWHSLPALSKSGNEETAKDRSRETDASQIPRPTTNKALSIFISRKRPPSERRTNRRGGSWDYRGAIYAMSTPSSSSPTVYTGILDGLVRLDFASTDDIMGSNGDWHRSNITLPHYADTNNSPSNGFHHHHTQGESDIFNIAGYERPGPDFVIAQFRSQKSFAEVTQEDILRERLSGWDRRWRDLDEMKSWRRGGT